MAQRSLLYLWQALVLNSNIELKGGKMRKERREKIKAARNFIKRFDSRLWLVPGSEGRRYEVRRLAKTNSFECHRLIGRNSQGFGRQPCLGNSYSLCYHVLAAVYSAAAEKRLTIAFCESEEAAQKLSRLGGKVYRISSAQSGKSVWAVLFKKKRR